VTDIISIVLRALLFRRLASIRRKLEREKLLLVCFAIGRNYTAEGWGLMSWRLITVTQTLVARLGKLRCRLCSRKLEVGEKVWSHLTIGCRRYNGASHHTRHYCKECYKKLWV
jgi:hypothetical protein